MLSRALLEASSRPAAFFLGFLGDFLISETTVLVRAHHREFSEFRKI
jgi:hypothetical protein